MKKLFLILTILCVGINSTLAVDEYILPDADNFVDLRHVKRATCTVLYYDPAHITYKEGAGPGMAGDSTPSTIGSIIGGQIGGWFGGWPGGQIGSLIGQAIGGGMSIGYTGKPPSPEFHPGEMKLLGTGVVYTQTDTHYYVLTAGHAVDRVPYVQFNYAGERSEIIPVTICMKIVDEYDDICVLSFPKSSLKGYPEPTVIPLVRDYKKSTDGVVMRFGSITHTKIINNRGDVFQLNTPIYKGISGSPIVDKNGKQLLGIVLKLNGECISNKRIIELMDEHNKRITK